MIVGVKQWHNAPGYNWYNVPVTDPDKARKVAFRFARRQKEIDFNQLVWQTLVIQPTEIPQDVADFIGEG